MYIIDQSLEDFARSRNTSVEIMAFILIYADDKDSVEQLITNPSADQKSDILRAVTQGQIESFELIWNGEKLF